MTEGPRGNAASIGSIARLPLTKEIVHVLSEFWIQSTHQEKEPPPGILDQFSTFWSFEPDSREDSGGIKAIKIPRKGAIVIFAQLEV